MDLEDKILNRIKNENIQMRPRWFFRAREIFLSTVAFVSILISAILLGISIDIVTRHASGISIESIPYGLLTVSIGTLFLAYKFLVSSFSFYKIRTSLLVALLALVIVFTGYFSFAYGKSEKADGMLQQSYFYQKIAPKTSAASDEI